jgi:hypothetical protein
MRFSREKRKSRDLRKLRKCEDALTTSSILSLTI